MPNKIKVLLVDDHAVVRAGFRLLLASSADIDVVAEADCGEKVCSFYEQYSVDVVIMDITMPGIGGLESIRRLCSRHSSAKILVFSIHDEAVYVERAINAGAKGYITKTSAAEIMLEAVYKIAEGGEYVEQGLIIAENEMGIDLLSVREFDVFCLLAKGMTARKIADQLCLSSKTVSNYSTQIKLKLKVNTVAELAHIAIAAGIV